MNSFARIAVNIPSVTGVFDYRLPPELEGKIGAGHLVTVPFGRQTAQGVVLELIARPSVAETKPILELLDPLPVLTGCQIELARQLARTTLNPLAAIIELMLPSGLGQQADVLYTLRNSQSEIRNQQSTATQSRLLKLLKEKGALRGRQIDRHFNKVDWRKAAQVLVRGGEITSQSILPPPTVRPKFIRTAQLAVPPEEAEAALPGLGKTAATLSRRQSALRLLMRDPDAIDVAWVYAESGCNLADLQELDERGLIVLHETEIWRDPLGKIESGEQGTEHGNVPLELTPDQQYAWDTIQKAFQASSNPAESLFLLHGVTGSGKTEIYLRAAAEAIRRGRQAIMLVPEIAITRRWYGASWHASPGRWD